MSASRGAIRAGAAHSARRRARVRGAAARAAADPPFNAVNVIHLIHVIRATTIAAAAGPLRTAAAADTAQAATWNTRNTRPRGGRAARRFARIRYRLIRPAATSQPASDANATSAIRIAASNGLNGRSPRSRFAHAYSSAPGA